VSEHLPSKKDVLSSNFRTEKKIPPGKMSLKYGSLWEFSKVGYAG
jgi:hypothetical protein